MLFIRRKCVFLKAKIWLFGELSIPPLKELRIVDEFSVLYESPSVMRSGCWRPSCCLRLQRRPKWGFTKSQPTWTYSQKSVVHLTKKHIYVQIMKMYCVSWEKACPVCFAVIITDSVFGPQCRIWLEKKSQVYISVILFSNIGCTLTIHWWT